MSGPSITILDYGIGNVLSLKNSLDRLGYRRVTISGSAKTLLQSNFAILPGVGAFEACMRAIRTAELVQPLNEYVLALRKPILGICVGMQMMVQSSEEFGLHAGFGWLKGKVGRLAPAENVRLPHVGWNDVLWSSHSTLDLSSLSGMNYYFDHSYGLIRPSEIEIATTNYGGSVCAAIGEDNIFGVQFHPERSQSAGLRFFRKTIEGLTSC